jgi:hypothetical protein
MIMETEKISPNIKAALKVNLERKAPSFLLGNIMKQVAVQPKLNLAPPTNYTLLVLGLAVGLACIALPLLYTPTSFASTTFKLPQIEVSPIVWLSAISLMLLYAADQFLSRKQLKRIMHR